MSRSFIRSGRSSLLVLLGFAACLVGAEVRFGLTRGPDQWRQHDIRRPKPPVVEPVETPISARPPADAVVLFDGSSLSGWKGADGGPAAWKVRDGYMEVTPGTGAIRTRGEFGDVQLHVEWAAPNPPAGKGQDRGNSGIFLMGLFEVQVLDSYRADTYADGQAGAIYGMFPPLANAARPPGEWQSYDIAFRRPRWGRDGTLQEPARLTIFHNGILIQDNEELPGETTWLEWYPYHTKIERGPIELQDHSHPVRFRNIWLRNLPERPRPTPRDLERPKTISLETAALNAFTGDYVTGTGRTETKVVVTREGDHLLFKLPFRPTRLRLDPVSDTEFAMPYTDGRFVFRKDGQGRVTGALFRIADGERELTRTGP